MAGRTRSSANAAARWTDSALNGTAYDQHRASQKPAQETTGGSDPGADHRLGRDRSLRAQYRPHGRGRRQGARRLSEAARGRQDQKTRWPTTSPTWSRRSAMSLEYWLSDPQRALELQTESRHAPISICGRPPSSAWPAKQADAGRDARSARTNASPIRNGRKTSSSISSSRPICSPRDWGEQLVQGRRRLDAHTRHKAEFYVKQIANAISPSNFVCTNPELLRETLAVECRQPCARHAYAHRGHRGRPRRSQDPPVGPLEVRGRPQPRAHARQGVFQNDLMQLIQYEADHRGRAQAPAADRAALDQQVLHPRSHAGKILHQMVRRSGHHGFRDFLGQSGRTLAQQRLRRYMREGLLAALDAIEKVTGEKKVTRHRLLRRRHAACRSRSPIWRPRSDSRIAVGDVVRRAGRLHLCRAI